MLGPATQRMTTDRKVTLITRAENMKSIDAIIADLKMRSSDDQVAIMRALADDNGYLVVAGYSITGKDPAWDAGELEGCGKDTARAIAHVDGEEVIRE